MNEKTDLYERFKTMPAKDLDGYKLAAKIIGCGSAIFGISFILFAMFFTNIMSVLAAFVACWVFGGVSVEIDNAMRIIDKLLLKKAKADK